MFEFLFKYPASVFSKGTFVLLGAWPRWILYASVFAIPLVLGGLFWLRHRRLLPGVRGRRSLIISTLQWATLALLLLLLWEPAVSVTTLKPQQNIIAVVLDDSRSMALADEGEPRAKQAADFVSNRLLTALNRKFQVRLYKLGAGMQRIDTPNQLHAAQPSTQIGRGLGELANEAATLPIGSIVLLSDGADNSGNIDAASLAELRRRRIPVNTVGYGKERLANDIELLAFDMPSKALAASRLQAQVTLQQNGFGNRHARLVVTAGGALVANREIVLRNVPEQTESVEFSAGKAGVKNVEIKLTPLEGETNTANNRLTRILSVDDRKCRILYVEGEPRWEYKFLRRAAENDPALDVVSMLRTTQNKIYRQGISNPEELRDGFPVKPEALFEYDALILGSVESAFFTTAQQQMMKDFVDRRGGGLLFLGGRASLADGGYNIAPFSELLPVNLPNRKNTFQRSFVAAELTEAGKQSVICRVEDDGEKNIEHWEVLPYLANYQDPGTPKPGAVVLANADVSGKHLPLLAIENYGRGRTAVLATGGTWRWKMQQPSSDTSQETFWRQLLRWTASTSPSRVTGSVANSNLADDGHVELRAEVRDKSFLPIANAEVAATIMQPNGSSQTIRFQSDPLSEGMYSAKWNATDQGAYVAEVTARAGNETLGRDVVSFRREDGVAENFHREQNRDLLEKLAEETGGRYYTPKSASRLPDEIAYSEAGMTSREMKDLWNMPALFLLLLMLRASEWLLRRRWGVL